MKSKQYEEPHEVGECQVCLTVQSCQVIGEAYTLKGFLICDPCWTGPQEPCWACDKSGLKTLYTGVCIPCHLRHLEWIAYRVALYKEKCDTNDLHVA